MTPNFKTCAPLLTLVAFAAAAPLAAEEPMTVTGQHVYQERVTFSDLNLIKWSNQVALRRRVLDASERVCIDAVGPLDANLGLLGGPSCTQMTYDHVRPQIADAISRARSGQAMAANLTVRIVVRTR